MREYGSEFESPYLPDKYFEKISSKFVDSHFFRSGRDALKFLSFNLYSRSKSILLPAFSCESMILPFKKADWNVFFYPLNDDLTVNASDFLTLLVEKSPDVILVMNYFGITPTSNIISVIKKNRPECLIVEDITHCLFDLDLFYNKNVDFYIASIRKWISVNDGAILLSKILLNNKPDYVNNNFVEIRRYAQNLMTKYLSNGDLNLKNEYRKVLKNAEKYLDDDSCLGISVNSLNVINQLNRNVINYKRNINYEHLSKSLRDISSITLFKNIDNVSNITPFCLPILVENRDEIQMKLANKGVYAPILWPLDPEAKTICSVSSKISDHILAIPIDQRYNFEDIEDISRTILLVLN